MTADPAHAAETLVSLCPVVFRSHWATLLEVAGAGARPVTPWKSPAGKLGQKTGSDFSMAPGINGRVFALFVIIAVLLPLRLPGQTRATVKDWI